MFRNRMSLALLGGTLSVLASVPIAAAPAVTPFEVDVKLVLATDVSRSINDEEASLERQGTADVFLDPDVVKAIQSGSLGRIAVAMIDWSSMRMDEVVLDWTIVRDKESAAALAAKIRAIPRTPGERTSISGALQRAMELLNDSDRYLVAEKKVIDVSGDGPNNDGISLQHVHDTTKDNGIIVNGLPIMDKDADGYYPDLDKYYDACVVAGKGAFLIPVLAFKDFGTAMRRKLVLEISQNETQIRQIFGELQNRSRTPFYQPVAATTAPPLGPRLQLNPPAKIYPGGCDKYGGYGVGGG
jgi:Protein of unknown function (DUF1194)